MNYQITDHEKFMMEKMGDYLARYVETSSPVTLDFQPKTLYFEIDDTENFGKLTVARNVAEDILFSCGCSWGRCARAQIGSIPAFCPPPMPRR